MTGTPDAPQNYDRHDLIDELKNFDCANDRDLQNFRNQFLEFLNAAPRCFYRDCFDPGHITGSAILLNMAGDKILMNYHKKLNRWLIFGGHADGEEDMLNVAVRETMEESGITAFKPVNADIIDFDIHTMPAHPGKGEPPHLHYDIRYVMQMTDKQNPVISDESTRLEWMDFNQAYAITGDDIGFKRLLDKIKIYMT